MHFIFSPFGSSGDVHPMLGVALAMRDRGHQITFLTNGYFRELVQQFGLEFGELGTREEFLAAASNPDLWHPFKAPKHIFRNLIELGVRPQYHAFAERYVPGETFGVINCFGLGALTAQDKLGLPSITAHLQPAVIWSKLDQPVLAGMFGPRWMRNLQFRIAERFVIDPAICPALNAFRAELGLSPVRNMTQWWHSASGITCWFPEWYCRPPADWPKPLVQTDFPLWDEHDGEPLPADVAAFLAAGSPPLVFTPGSANMFGREFFQAAVAACQALDRRGILLTRFSDQVPRDLPKSVAHFRYVPFGQLLPRAAAVAHHAGVGSTAQGMAAGIPQLLMPLAHDQFDNAHRVVQLGVGDWLTSAQFTAPRVTEKLRALLSSAQVVESCRSVAARMANRDGCARTAVALEAWAEGAKKSGASRTASAAV